MWKKKQSAQAAGLKNAHLIELRDICKFYNEGEENEVRALENVSLCIDRGEFVCILGQSGSGKSTLMNLLGCLDQPTHGTYQLNGTPVEEIDPPVLADIRNREIGFIFQNFNLIPTLTALENVELPLIYRGMSHAEMRELAMAALREVGLENRMWHMPKELSGGQQQRVAIARAMASRPPVIMADEPTGNLDSKSGLEIMERLLRLNEEQGSTIILITHDNFLATRARRILTIADGRILSDLPTEEYLEQLARAAQTEQAAAQEETSDSEENVPAEIAPLMTEDLQISDSRVQ